MGISPHSGRAVSNRKPIIRALVMVFAISGLLLIQWATKFRGDLLWIAIMALGIVLAWTFIEMIRGPFRASGRFESERGTLSGNWLDELHRNDPHYLGSPYYRSHFEDESRLSKTTH